LQADAGFADEVLMRVDAGSGRHCAADRGRRAFLVLADVFHRTLGVAAGEGVLLGGFDAFDDVVIIQHGSGGWALPLRPVSSFSGAFFACFGLRIGLGQRFCRIALGAFSARPMSLE
jgi:hypothetical protein